MKKYIIICLLTLSGCCTGGKCLTPGQLKCNGTKLMICDGNKDWKLHRDCAKYKAVCKKGICVPKENQ